jgi:hypothetical protein
MDAPLLRLQQSNSPSTGVVEHFGVGTSKQESDGVAYNVTESLGEDDYQRYNLALGSVLGLDNRFTATLVERNFQSYLDCQKFAATLIGLGRAFGSNDGRPLAEALMGQIANWLTSFRLFLDHAETRLKRQFGRDSAQFSLFKQRTAEAFDQHAGYRFVCKFRNYVQHCGAPLSRLTVGKMETPPLNRHLRQHARFLLSRSELLENFEWGSPVRADLEAMEEEVDLEPLASEAMEQLRDIDRLIFDIAITEAARTIGDLRELLAMMPQHAAGSPTLFRYTTAADRADVTSISPRLIPIGLVEALEGVADGQIRPSELHSTPQRNPNPNFDPATVSERFRRDSRAVQVMSLWQAEGGGTPHFEAELDRMVQEDQGGAPMVTGMVNMTAVLLHMTAASLGVAPEGLLGGLLDIYAGSADG